MKNFTLLTLLLASIALTGCSGAFWGGAAGGTAAGAAGYEINSKVQMDRIKKDLDEGRITQQEYDIRRSQIERGSLIYKS